MNSWFSVNAGLQARTPTYPTGHERSPKKSLYSRHCGPYDRILSFAGNVERASLA